MNRILYVVSIFFFQAFNFLSSIGRKGSGGWTCIQPSPLFIPLRGPGGHDPLHNQKRGGQSITWAPPRKKWRTKSWGNFTTECKKIVFSALWHSFSMKMVCHTYQAIFIPTNTFFVNMTKFLFDLQRMICDTPNISSINQKYSLIYDSNLVYFPYRKTRPSPLSNFGTWGFDAIW